MVRLRSIRLPVLAGTKRPVTAGVARSPLLNSACKMPGQANENTVSPTQLTAPSLRLGFAPRICPGFLHQHDYSRY